jgi:hypothetical protein
MPSCGPWKIFLQGARCRGARQRRAVVRSGAGKYSISGERNKCLLHLWSDERNLVRRVLDVEVKNQVLHLAVQGLGQARPGKLEICRQRDRRTPTAKRAARLAYQRSLQGTLERLFSAYQASRLRSSIDLERSFGPIYARVVAARTIRLRRAGSESAGDAVFDRRRVDFCHSVA